MSIILNAVYTLGDISAELLLHATMSSMSQHSVSYYRMFQGYFTFKYHIHKYLKRKALCNIAPTAEFTYYIYTSKYVR